MSSERVIPSRRLAAGTARYDGTAATLRGDLPVRLFSPRYDATAERFSADLRQDEVTLEGAVSTAAPGGTR